MRRRIPLPEKDSPILRVLSPEFYNLSTTWYCFQSYHWPSLPFLKLIPKVLTCRVTSPTSTGRPSRLMVSSSRTSRPPKELVRNISPCEWKKAWDWRSTLGYTNPQFNSQYTGATKVGIIRGGYHFARPDKSTGAAQATYFLAHGGKSSAIFCFLRDHAKWFSPGGWSADGTITQVSFCCYLSDAR